MFLTLSLLKNAAKLQRSFQNRLLGTPSESLYGKRVLLFGFGHVGQQVAKLLRPFGCSISAIRGRSVWEPADVEQLDEVGVFGDNCMTRLIGQADIIILCCHLTPSTVGMVNRSFLATVRPGVGGWCMEGREVPQGLRKRRCRTKARYCQMAGRTDGG